MENQRIKVSEEKKKPEEGDIIIFKSPFQEKFKNTKIPEISWPDFLFNILETKSEECKNNVWVTDIIKGKSYKFSDIKPISTKFASALYRMGFRKRDVFYYVTYDVSLIYIIEIGVWMIGGVTRGCFQKEEKEELLRQMKEVSTRFILCDPETAENVKCAAESLDWPIHWLSIGGEVEGATAVEDLIDKDDGSAFPHDLKINPKEDLFAIFNTSGSTGLPKGAMHTHYNQVTVAAMTGDMKPLGKKYSPMGKSVLTLLPNYAIATVCLITWSIMYDFSWLNMSKYEPKAYIKNIQKYKPETLFLYPFVANWLARALETETNDISFVKTIFCGGWVLDAVTCKLLEKNMPQVKMMQVYGTSEFLMISSFYHSQISTCSNPDEEIIAGLKVKKVDGGLYTSSGQIMSLVEAKIVDPTHGCTLGPNVAGNVWIKVPYVMKGYVSGKNDKNYVPMADEDGWYNTGDYGFIDEESHIYIIERQSCFFKYHAHHVSPAEIENVVGEHPAVLSVGVVGVPDPVIESAARAYVVLKPNVRVTEEEIIQFVAERKNVYKQLHGGVAFVESLPASRGGKLDRSALLKNAIAELQSTAKTNLQKTKAD